MKAIVTTTINPPTEALRRFAAMEDWTLIVVGDLKTPHEAYKEVRCLYLSPDDQEKRYPDLSEALGWRTIQRRNVGFVEAYRLGAEVIATVDDDNIPYEGWGQGALGPRETDIYKSERVFNPLKVVDDHLWHRGFPLELLHDEVTLLGTMNILPLVQADLWDGDPDVDAVERLIWRPEVKFRVERPFTTPDWTPFNSQNTFLRREAFPHYCVLPFVGRMDDIWGAYRMQQRLGRGRIVFCQPSVYQQRNEHNLMADMEKEVIGFHTLDFIEGRYELPDDTKRFLDAYERAF